MLGINPANARFCEASPLFFFTLPYCSKKGPDEPEGDLIAEARAGDEAAFGRLVELHRERVFGIAWQLTHRREDALDVTQEAFVRVWHALPSYHGKSRFSTWLHRIVLNTGIDYIRRESRHGHVSLEPDEDEGPACAHEASSPPVQRDRVYEAQLQRMVLNALGQISPRQREVFVLRYYHGLSLKETAEIIRATEGTVKRHLSRAQEQLRELLGHLKDQ